MLLETKKESLKKLNHVIAVEGLAPRRGGGARRYVTLLAGPRAGKEGKGKQGTAAPPPPQCTGVSSPPFPQV